MTLHSCRNGMVIPFLLEWNGSFHSCRNGVTPFESSQNGMTTPLLQEWHGHSILAGMEWVIPLLQEWSDSIRVQPEWNDHSITAGMECHSILSGRKLPLYSIPSGMEQRFHTNRRFLHLFNERPFNTYNMQPISCLPPIFEHSKNSFPYKTFFYPPVHPSLSL